MKKVLWGFIGTMLLAHGICLSAQDETMAVPKSRPHDSYSVTLQGVYDFSTTFGHQGGLDLAGHMPFNPYFEADAGFEFMGPKTLAATFVARPKFPVAVGELFLEGAIHVRAFKTSEIANYSMSACFGYRMDFVSVQLGVQSMTFFDLLKKKGDSNMNITEPVNFVYKLAFNVRPCTSPWNISLGVANFTLYQYERFYCPILFLCGHYDVTDHMAVQASVDFKPSGVFHMTTHFNELSARAGLTYRF